MRRRTRRRVQDMLRSDRSADCRTDAGANAAQEGPDIPRGRRVFTPTALIVVILAFAVREDEKYRRGGSGGESDQSTPARVATALRDERHVRGGPRTRAVVHEQVNRRRRDPHDAALHFRAPLVHDGYDLAPMRIGAEIV